MSKANNILKQITLTILASSIVVGSFVPMYAVQARARYGSFRIGGYTSHGKGSHYIGGYVRSGIHFRARSHK